MICPRIFIFTREKQTFFNIYKDNKNLLINDPFYNPGSVQDTLQPVLNFIKKRKEHKFIQNIVQFELSSKDFNFEYIKEKEQLILSIYLPNYINQANESKIQKFNEYILNEYSNEENIVSLFDRLINIEKIPHEILSKYWIRAYTAETKFYKNMNEDLRKSKVKKYLTYIQMMYEGIKIKSFTTNNSKMLYRGTYFSFEEIKTLLNYISNKKEGLPAALVSCKSFLSFSLNKNVAQSYLKSKKNLITVLLIIDNNNDYSIIHSGSAAIKQFSFYSDEEEILFFPFSCFEIKKIEKSYNNLYIITLNYLGKYEKLFKKLIKN